MAVSLKAATFGDFTYEVVGDSVSITDYPKVASGALIIPSEIEGKPVTVIEKGAISYCASLTSVVVPDSVIAIGEGAFEFCSSLSRVKIGKGVTTIGEDAFGGTYTLTVIAVSKANSSFSSRGGVLYDKAQTAIVQCPKGYIGAFKIPDTVTSISESAFSDCDSLTSVTIGRGISQIPEYAFENCNALTSVSIPDSVISIDANAFAACESLTLLEIPNSVTSIGKKAFYDCASLVSVTIPDSVTFIGESAFQYCDSLASVTLPDGLTIIPTGAFYACNSLASLTLGESVRNIGDYAFGACDSLTLVSFPASLASIKSYAFLGCSVLDKASFEGNSPNVGRDIFSMTPANFRVYYSKSSSGFSEPKWKGYRSVAGMPMIRITSSNHNFSNGSTKSYGQVAVGNAVKKTFKIKNAGTAPLKKLKIAKDGTSANSFVLTAPLETTLAPGGITTFTITFRPIVPGALEAAIHITSYDSIHDPFDIKLKGQGVSKSSVQSEFVANFDEPFRLAKTQNLTDWSDLVFSPTVEKSVIDVIVSDGEKFLTITVNKELGTLRQPRTVEVSPDLIHWYSGANFTTVIQDDATLLKVRDNTPCNAGAKRFIRLK